MSFKIVFFCAQICLIKTAFAQCIGPKPGFIPEGLGLMGAPFGRFESSLLLENYPMPTPGLSIVADDLIIEGLVSVSGSLPFLGTVAIEGILPTEGQGTVLYSCGNGEVGIMAENASPYGPELIGPLAGTLPGPFTGPIAPGFAGPMGSAFAPCGSPCNLGPIIDSGMAGAANTAAMAAAANSMGQAAAMKSVGFRGAANAAGLTANGVF